MQDKILTQNLGKKRFLRLKKMFLWVSEKKKNMGKNFFVLKVTKERSWIRIHKSEVRIRIPNTSGKQSYLPVIVCLKLGALTHDCTE